MTTREQIRVKLKTLAADIEDTEVWNRELIYLWQNSLLEVSFALENQIRIMGVRHVESL